MAPAALEQLAGGARGVRRGMPVAIATLPASASFWISAALAALLAATLIVNAWGRYIGGLLVTPALMLLFLMNIFPLLWSLGLSFFSYRANRARAPSWVGLDNYAKVLTDPDVWDRLHNTVIMVVLTVTTQMIVGFLLALAVFQAVSASALSDDSGADADDALVRRRRRLLPLLLRSDLRAAFAGGARVHRSALHPDANGMGRARRHRLRRRLDVVALRHAAGAGRPRQRAEISLRGRRDRPGACLAAVHLDHLPLYPRPAAAGAAVPHDRGVQAVRSRIPADQRRAGHRDRDHCAPRLSRRLREQQDQRVRRRSPTSCCSPSSCSPTSISISPTSAPRRPELLLETNRVLPSPAADPPRLCWSG